MKRMFNKLWDFARNEQGTATLEFVIAFPFMFSMIVLTFDSGLLMTKYVVLENALDRVVRDVRLVGISDGEAGATYFKEQVCDIAALIKDCEESLHIEMTPINTGALFAPGDVTCVDRNAANPSANSVTPGQPNEIVYVRACLVVDRYFPSALSGIFTVDASGGIRLVADSAYVTEPL